MFWYVENSFDMFYKNYLTLDGKKGDYDSISKNHIRVAEIGFVMVDPWKNMNGNT